MKNIILSAAFLLFNSALLAQKLPKLMANGDKPSFSRMECFHKLEKEKERHCNRHAYAIYIAGDTLVITETKTNWVDRPKKAEDIIFDYRVHLKDVKPLSSEKKLKYDNLTYSITDLEGTEKRMYKFDLDAEGEKIMTRQWGKRVGLNSLRLYCDSQEDASEFLIYVAGETIGK